MPTRLKRKRERHQSLPRRDRAFALRFSWASGSLKLITPHSLSKHVKPLQGVWWCGGVGACGAVAPALGFHAGDVRGESVLRQGAETRARRRNRLVDFRVRMRRGNEKRFVLRWRQKNSSPQHFLEESSKSGRIGFLRVGVIADRITRKENRKQRSCAIHDAFDASLAQSGSQPVGQPQRLAI